MEQMILSGMGRMDGPQTGRMNDEVIDMIKCSSRTKFAIPTLGMGSRVILGPVMDAGFVWLGK
jgi:hypothetical protein